jgi:hypothetical protein
MQRSGTKVRINVWRIALISSLLVGVVAASTQIEVGFQDASYPPGTGSNSKPTGEKPESKLWFNDGSWWGVLWSTPGNAYTIHQLDLGTQDWVDTGTVVDTRSKSRQDALWDGTYLYVASHVYSGTGQPAKASDRGKLYRFSYNPVATPPYSKDSGFPVEVTGGKGETLVLAKDTTGTLWVTYVENKTVMVNHSVGDDRTWAGPVALQFKDTDGRVKIANNLDSDDIASIIAYDGHVGIMWSRQTYNNLDYPTRDPNEGSGGLDCSKGRKADPDDCEGRTAEDTDHLANLTMYFAVHDNGAPASAWTGGAVYNASGDDHINLKASGGRLYAAIKTATDAILINLLVCDTQSSGCTGQSDWHAYPVFRTKDNEGESDQADLLASSQPDPSRAVVLIDEGNSDLYVFAMVEQGDPAHRTINYKKTKLDAINFDTADPGIPFIRSANDPLINDPTSTKQNLNSNTGLVVLASDEEAFCYFHNYLGLNNP